MDKQKIYYIIGIIAVLLVAVYVFSGNRIGGQAGFDAVKNGLNNTATEQRAVSDQLVQSEQALAIAEEQLTVSNNRIATLKQQLITLEQQAKTAEQLSRTAEKDLNAANQLLNEWKKERDKEIAKIKQKNKVYKLVLIGLTAKMLFGGK